MKCNDSELSFKVGYTNTGSNSSTYGFHAIQTIQIENSSGVIETIDYYNGVC